MRALLAALTTLPLAALTVVPLAPAHADVTSVPGTMTTATQSQSAFAVPVPAGVEVRAIDGVVTEPEVVQGGTITFRVNGAVRKTVPSSLYQKVRIPLAPADVIADGTVGLTMSTEGPAVAGAACLPTGGVASMRKIELDYRGAEAAPTTVADFFPPSSSGVTVVIPEDANAQMITAGLTAVAALAHRYDDDTPIDLSLSAPPPEDATASRRVVALVQGPPGDVATAVSTTSGIPMLTLTGAGDALVNAARALSTDLLGLSGSDAQDLSQQTKPRSTAATRTLEDLGTDALSLSGYGSVAQQLELRQDSFGAPVSSMELHLKGSHTAFASGSGARLDVRANGDLVGSRTLGEEATFDLDVHIPSSKLQSVNDIELTLNALAPDGSACTPPSIPAAEVDLDTGASTVTVTHGTGDAKGFQLFPQILEGTLPIALRSAGDRQASAAINAAALVAELQRAAGSQLDIQLMAPDAFLADDRSGLIVGALNGDSEALDAPLKLSSTRLIDRDDATVEVTSQDPYAVLESVDRNDRLVLMLGSWAPGNKAAPGELARKVVDAVVNTGWDKLDGDLVIADAANPSFVAASRSLAPHHEKKKEKSYAKWFVLVIAVLLLLLALQVVMAIRRDRRLSRERDDEFGDDGPAYVEDEPETEYDVDELGDVDDLEVHDYAGAEPADHPEAEAEDGAGEELADGPDHEYEAERESEPVEEPEAYDDFDDTGEIEAVDADEYDDGDAGDTGDAGDAGDQEQPDEPEEQPGAVAGPERAAAPEGDAEDAQQPADDWEAADWEDWADESDEVTTEPSPAQEPEPPRRRWSDQAEPPEPVVDPPPPPEPPSPRRGRKRRGR